MLSSASLDRDLRGEQQSAAFRPPSDGLCTESLGELRLWPISLGNYLIFGEKVNNGFALSFNIRKE
jgi:hypothetical protein